MNTLFILFLLIHLFIKKILAKKHKYKLYVSTLII